MFRDVWTIIMFLNVSNVFRIEPEWQVTYANSLPLDHSLMLELEIKIIDFNQFFLSKSS